MKLINKLREALESKGLDLLNNLLKEKKYMSASEIRRKFDKRNPRILKQNLEEFFKLGLILKKQRNCKIGRGHVKTKFIKYKINLDSNIIKFLRKEV